jgi:hypothetical protein
VVIKRNPNTFTYAQKEELASEVWFCFRHFSISDWTPSRGRSCRSGVAAKP